MTDTARLAKILETVSGNGPLASPGDDIRWLIEKLTERDAEIERIFARLEDLADVVREDVDLSLNKLSINLRMMIPNICKKELRALTDEELAAIEESCKIIDELGAECTTLRCLELARTDVPALIAEVRWLRAIH